MNTKVLKGRIEKHLNSKVFYHGEVKTNKDLYSDLILNKGFFFSTHKRYKYKIHPDDLIKPQFLQREIRVEVTTYNLVNCHGVGIKVPKIIYDYKMSGELDKCLKPLNGGK